MEAVGPQREQLGWRERFTTFMGRVAVLASESLAYIHNPAVAHEIQQNRLTREADFDTGMHQIDDYLANH